MTHRPRFIPRPFRKTALTMTIAVAGALGACGGNDDGTPAATLPVTALPSVAVGDTIALTASGKLLSFNRTDPAQLVGTVAITGIASGETLLGIDTRPADGRIYALGSRGTIYTIDPSSGVAMQRSTLVATTGDDNPYTALTGTDFAVDFNPVADRLRVVGNNNVNLRINVDTGAVITDGTIATSSGAASITAAAYTNAFAGATSTQLYDIDAASGTLYLQDPPNNGTLATGRSLGVGGGAVNGFDIDARSNIGYAALGDAAGSALFTINLASGIATRVGTIAGGEAIRGLTLKGIAAPSVLGLTGDNRLVAFDPKAPNTLTSTTPITGLGAAESVIGIDFRPANGLLYALTANGRIYTVDPTTGVATFRSALSADSTDATAPYTTLAGTTFSVDFNPVADRMRVIGSTGQDLRINVDNGATTTDGDINRATVPATIVAAAYTGSFAGATATTLYDLEANSDVLTTQNPPNNGTLVNVGPLGLDLAGTAGFDIAGGDNGLVLAALRIGTGGPFSLYTVALTTGVATLYLNTGGAALSQIGGAGGPALLDIAIRF